jgi:hypothetical protein
MKSNVAQRQTLVSPRKGERGSALIMAIMFMVVLFAITLAAAKVRVASAKDTEDQNAQQNAYWDARSGAATVQASLLTDVPAAFNADLIRARGMAGASTLTAFDSPCYSSSCTSKPVMNPDGGRTAYPISECTSLLGNIDAWAQQRGIPVAENYAASRGYGPTRTRVAVLREHTRQQMVGTSSTEPAYVLEFQIDAIASDQGRLRPSGTIMLSPAQVGCETSVSLEANPTSIPTGGSSSLTATYQWANTVSLKDSNGNTIDTRSGLNETAAPQTITFTVTPAATTTYRAEATGSGGCTAVSGERTVIVTFPPPEIISFTINPPCINRGQSATLSWSVSYASNITITGGGLSQPFPGSPAGVISGTLKVSPLADTTYMLTATGPGGSAQAQTAVTVKQPFTIDSFAASTYCVTPGANVDLSWTITNAESANINGIAVSSTGGTLRVNPVTTTTYTLSATRTGCFGPETITRAITVSVVPVPTATLSANPARIELGQSTSLQWTTSGAASANITPSPAAGSGLGGLTSATPVPSGSLSVTPTQVGTYTYTLTATGTGCSTQQARATATVIVDPVPVPPPCPTINSFVGDSCILPGSNATLQWNVIDFDTITITGGGINNTYLTGSGSLVVSPSSPTTYTLTAARTGCVPRSATVTVNIADVPAVNSFTASPSTITPGQSSMLQWSVSNTASVRITGTDGSTYFPGGNSLIVSPASTTTYTLTATSGGCSPQQAQAQATVSVGLCPTINYFAANPSGIIAGSNSTLQWSVSNAAAVLLNGNPVASSGSQVVTPAVTTTYRLTARSTNGTCDLDQFVTVNVSACPTPQVASFTANPNSVTQGGSQMVRLSWTINDSSGTGVTVTISPGVGTFSVANGFVDISQPAATTTYTLAANNGCGAPAAPAQVQVTVNQPPVVSCPVLVAGAPDYVASVSASGAVSAPPNPYSTVNIQVVARHYQNDTMGINMKLTISNGNDPFMFQTPQVLTGGYHGNLGKYKFKFYLGQYSSFFSSFNAIRGIELYDSSDNLVQTIPFENISSNGSQNIYVMKGFDITTAYGDVVFPYPNFDPGADKIGVAALTVRAFDQNGSGQALDTPVAAQESSFGCTEYYNNQGAKNEVVAPHNNMYITGFVETYADGHIRADATSGGIGNEIVNGYWIKTTYDYHIILSRDGVPFTDMRYSYEHTPAVPYASPTVFELPASQVPAGTGPVTMWAELTGTVYNQVYTETLHTTIDTTQPDDTKFPGDSPPPVPVYGRSAYIGECNGDIPGACTNQKTNNGLRW